MSNLELKTAEIDMLIVHKADATKPTAAAASSAEQTQAMTAKAAAPKQVSYGSQAGYGSRYASDDTGLLYLSCQAGTLPFILVFKSQSIALVPYGLSH
jgi:hypothetical protein